jgi:hypothetical protein
MIGVTKFSLGHDVVAAITEAKDKFRSGRLRPYNGHELSNAAAGRRGAHFLEHHVGHAHAGDSMAAGRRRLVLLIQSGRVEEMYFSDDHYRAGSWLRILDF